MTPKERREFHKRIELGGLSDGEITRYFSNQPRFGGVFSNDEFNDPDPQKVYILNLENSNEGGSHWTLYHNGWYFDSYGVVPTARIAPLVQSYNKNNYQGLNRSSCGYYCMYVADHIFAGVPAIGELKPDRQTHNENILEKYFFAF